MDATNPAQHRRAGIWPLPGGTSWTFADGLLDFANPIREPIPHQRLVWWRPTEEQGPAHGNGHGHWTHDSENPTVAVYWGIQPISSRFIGIVRVDS